MDLLIIENPGIHLFLETIKGCVILMYEQLVGERLHFILYLISKVMLELVLVHL